MTPRLMFVHAHPDDEASKGAATAARYVDEGAQVSLVTCTGGEAGDILNPNVEPIDKASMAQARARELAASIAAIGFTHTYELGYLDSGYHESAQDIPEGTFGRAPLDEPARELAAIVRHERPHVVVTYPQDGGYPHPDHIMNHAVTVRALELAEDSQADLSGTPAEEHPAWRVPKLYASMIYPTERVVALHEAMLEQGLESPFEKWFERRKDPTKNTDDEPDARVRCADWFERRDAALLAHVTQIDPNGRWFAVPRDLERQRYPFEAYLLLRSDIEVERPESELFAGIDVPAVDAAGGRLGSQVR